MKNKKAPQYILTLLIIGLIFIFSVGLSIWIITDTIKVKPNENDQTNQIIIEYLDGQEGTYNGNILLPSNTTLGLDINSERLTYSYKKENSDGTYPIDFTEVDLENKLGPIDAGNYKIKVSFVNYDNPETPIEQELDFVIKPKNINSAIAVFNNNAENKFYLNQTYEEFIKDLQVSIVLVENAQPTPLTINVDFTVTTPDLSEINLNASTTIVGKGNYNGQLTLLYSVNKMQLFVTLSKEHPSYNAQTGIYEFEYSKTGINFDEILIIKNSKEEDVIPTAITYSHKGLTDQGDYTNIGFPTGVAPYWLKIVVSATNYDDVMIDSIQVKINPISISSAVVNLANTTLTYNGSAQTIAVESVVFDGDTLVEGEDYEAPIYSNNVDAGTNKAVVTINGKGMYGDSVKAYFTINKATPTLTPHTYTNDAYIEGEQPLVLKEGYATFNGNNNLSGTIASNIANQTFTVGTSSTNNIVVTYTFVPNDKNANGTSNYNQATATKTLIMYGVAYNSISKKYYGTIEAGIENADSTNNQVWVVPGIKAATGFYPTIKKDVSIKNSTTFGLAYMFTADGTITPYETYNYPSEAYKDPSADANPSQAMIAENITLTVSSGGTLTIGAFIRDTGTVNKQSVLMNNGSIIVDNGGTVYSYGFTKGTGVVELKSGGTIYDVLKIYDFAGGRYAPGMYFKEYRLRHEITQERLNNILPFQSYSMHNISCELKIHTGSTFYTRADLNISQTIYVQNVVLFGSGGLFELSATSGFSENYVKRTVENTVETTDFNSVWESSNQSIYQREVYEFHTSVKDNPIQMHIAMEVVISVDLDFKTDKYTAMPIGLMDITIKNGHTLTIRSNSWKFLPGSKLTIEENAKLLTDSGVNVIFYEDYYDNFTVIDANGNPSSPASFSYYSKHTLLYDSSTKKVKPDYVTKFYVDGTFESSGNIGGTISATKDTGKVVLSSGSATLKRLSSIKYLGTSEVGAAAISWSNFGGVVYNDVQNSKMNLYNGTSINTRASNVATGTYYAISAGGKHGWYTDKLTISYDLNGGTGTVPSSVGPKDVPNTGYVVNSTDIPSISPTRLGYTFTGNWALDREGNEIVVAGQTKLFASVIFYPVWEPIEYTIDFNDKYYNNFSSEQIEYDEFKFFVTTPEYFPSERDISNGPVDAEYVFGGWFLDEACTIRVYSTNDIYINENASTYFANTTIKLYGLWYPNGTQRVIINYDSENNDVEYRYSDSFIIATDSDWNKVKLQLLTSEDNNPDIPLYFGGWKINDTETIINTNNYFTKDNYENYFTIDENNNLVCNLTAVWNNKIELTISSKVSTNAAEKIDSIFYKPGYTLVLSSINLELEDKTVLTEWQYSGGSQTGTASYSATEITLNSATQLTAIIKKVVTVRVTTVTNASNFTSYSLYVSQYVSNTYEIVSTAYSASKPAVNTEVLAVEGATITIKGTGGSYWLFGTHYYEIDLTIGSSVKSGGNATEVTNTSTVGTTDIEVKFEASKY